MNYYDAAAAERAIQAIAATTAANLHDEIRQRGERIAALLKALARCEFDAPEQAERIDALEAEVARLPVLDSLLTSALDANMKWARKCADLRERQELYRARIRTLEAERARLRAEAVDQRVLAQLKEQMAYADRKLDALAQGWTQGGSLADFTEDGLRSVCQGLTRLRALAKTVAIARDTAYQDRANLEAQVARLREELRITATNEVELMRLRAFAEKVHPCHDEGCPGCAWPEGKSCAPRA
jgi:hypothetical protein